MAYACYARMARCRAANLSLLGSPKQPIFSGAMTWWNTDDQQIRLIPLIQLDSWTLMDQRTTTDYNGLQRTHETKVQEWFECSLQGGHEESTLPLTAEESRWQWES